MFGDRQRPDIHGHAVPTLVQEESCAHLWPAFGEGHGHRTLLATEAVALPVASLHHIFQNMPHHFVRQIPGDVFRPMVPKEDSPFPVHEVNPHRQVFHHMPEQLRIIEKLRRHDQPHRLPSFIGSRGGLLQGPDGQQGRAHGVLHKVSRSNCSHPLTGVCRVRKMKRPENRMPRE